MAECEVNGYGISCAGGCGIVCERNAKGRIVRCRAFCNPEVSVFRAGGTFTLDDEVVFCSHNLGAESIRALLSEALPLSFRVTGHPELKKAIRMRGTLERIVARLGFSVQRRARKGGVR